MRKIDCIGSKGCVQFEEAQRKANIIYCLRGGIVWGYKLRYQGQNWVQIPAPPHIGYVTLGKYHGLSMPLFPHL